MSAPDTGFHAPVVLADERERRARRQRPYPSCVELKDLQGFEGVDEHAEAQRASRVLGSTAAIAVALLLVLVWWLARFFLKG